MKNKGIFLLLITIIILTSVIYWFGLKKSSRTITLPQSSYPSSTQLKIYKSSALDFDVQILGNFTVNEKWVGAEFTNENGIIQMGRNGNGFNSLKEYLMDLDEKNQSEKIFSSEELMINGYIATKRNEERGGVKARIYYIFLDDWVYVFSTDAEELYDDLDQIVRSFRYTPN